MSDIVRGTTPTIKYTFSTVDLTELESAVLTISQRSVTVQKTLSAAVVDSEAKTLSWTLTQSETLELTAGSATEIKLDWLLQNGTRGAGNSITVNVLKPGVNEVMT